MAIQINPFGVSPVVPFQAPAASLDYNKSVMANYLQRQAAEDNERMVAAQLAADIENQKRAAILEQMRLQSAQQQAAEQNAVERERMRTVAETERAIEASQARGRELGYGNVLDREREITAREKELAKIKAADQAEDYNRTGSEYAKQLSGLIKDRDDAIKSLASFKLTNTNPGPEFKKYIEETDDGFEMKQGTPPNIAMTVATMVKRMNAEREVNLPKQYALEERLRSIDASLQNLRSVAAKGNYTINENGDVVGRYGKWNELGSASQAVGQGIPSLPMTQPKPTNTRVLPPSNVNGMAAVAPSVNRALSGLPFDGVTQPAPRVPVVVNPPTPMVTPRQVENLSMLPLRAVAPFGDVMATPTVVAQSARPVMSPAERVGRMAGGAVSGIGGMIKRINDIMSAHVVPGFTEAKDWYLGNPIQPPPGPGPIKNFVDDVMGYRYGIDAPSVPYETIPGSEPITVMSTPPIDRSRIFYDPQAGWVSF